MSRLLPLSALATALLAPACLPEATFRGVGSTTDDAGPDGGPLAGNVTVRTISRDFFETPASDVQVLFVEPDGTVRADLTTGGSGEVTSEITRGGTLFVRYGQTFLLVVTEVEPGRTYTFGVEQVAFAPRGAPTSATVPRTVNATTYSLASPCGDGALTTPVVAESGSVPLQWRIAPQRGCSDGMTVGMMAFAEQAPGRPIASRYLQLPYGTAMPTFAATMLEAPQPITVRVTGNEDLALVTPVISAIEAGFRYGAANAPPIAAGESMVTSAYWRAGASDLLAGYILQADSPQFGVQYLAEQVPNQASLARDVSGAVRAPFVSAVTEKEDWSHVEWSQSDTGAAQHAILETTIVPEADPDSVRRIRTMFPAGDAREVRVPPLPAAVASFAPVTGIDTHEQVLRLTRVDDGVSYSDVAASFELLVRFTPDPTRLLSLQGVTLAAISMSP